MFADLEPENLKLENSILNSNLLKYAKLQLDRVCSPGLYWCKIEDSLHLFLCFIFIKYDMATQQISILVVPIIKHAIILHL